MQVAVTDVSVCVLDPVCVTVVAVSVWVTLVAVVVAVTVVSETVTVDAVVVCVTLVAVWVMVVVVVVMQQGSAHATSQFPTMPRTRTSKTAKPSSSYCSTAAQQSLNPDFFQQKTQALCKTWAPNPLPGPIESNPKP